MAHLKDRVEPYVNESTALSVCADICNSLKHFSIDGSRSGLDPKFSLQRFRRYEEGSDPENIGLAFLILTKDQSFDAFNLAAKCIHEWDTFLALNREIL